MALSKVRIWGYWLPEKQGKMTYHDDITKESVNMVIDGLNVVDVMFCSNKADEKGKLIYNGDIIKFLTYLDGIGVHEEVKLVIFTDGAFGVIDDYENFAPLCDLGSIYIEGTIHTHTHSNTPVIPEYADTHVYCTDCKYFTEEHLTGKISNHCTACEHRSPEDSRPYAERPKYVGLSQFEFDMKR